MINCSDEDDDLSSEAFLSKRWDNCRRSDSRSSLMSSEKESRISAIKTNRRIARKVCKWESVFKSFKNSKAMKAKTTFFDSDKSNLNINDCDERFFDLIFVWLVFDEALDSVSAVTIFATQNELISKHNFFAFLIIFRNLNIIFRVFARIFFTNDLEVFRLSNWFNFIRIVEKFHNRRSTMTSSIAEKIDVFIVAKNRRLKLNSSALNSIERYKNEARFL